MAARGRWRRRTNSRGSAAATVAVWKQGDSSRQRQQGNGNSAAVAAAAQRQRGGQLGSLAAAAQQYWQQHRGGKHGSRRQRCYELLLPHHSAPSARRRDGNEDTGMYIDAGGKDKELRQQCVGRGQLGGGGSSLVIALCCWRWQCRHRHLTRCKNFTQKNNSFYNSNRWGLRIFRFSKFIMCNLVTLLICNVLFMRV